MVECLGSWVQVDVEGGAAIVLEVSNESAAEGCLENTLALKAYMILRTVLHTFPAPAGPMTRTPNFDILTDLWRRCYVWRKRCDMGCEALIQAPPK